MLIARTFCKTQKLRGNNKSGYVQKKKEMGSFRFSGTWAGPILLFPNLSKVRHSKKTGFISIQRRLLLFCIVFRGVFQLDRLAQKIFYFLCLMANTVLAYGAMIVLLRWYHFLNLFFNYWKNCLFVCFVLRCWLFDLFQRAIEENFFTCLLVLRREDLFLYVPRMKGGRKKKHVPLPPSKSMSCTPFFYFIAV